MFRRIHVVVDDSESSNKFLISAGYDGSEQVAYLKFYDPETKSIRLWYDNTGHLPYCLSSLQEYELKKLTNIVNHPGLHHFEAVEKRDLLNDSVKKMTKIIAKDPLSIGGKPTGSIRDLLPQAWEAHIRYYDCYIYDRQFQMGMPYRFDNGKLTQVLKDEIKDDGKSLINDVLSEESEEYRNYITQWLKLFEQELPTFYRAALDIEVFSSIATRVPDSTDAIEPVIAVSIADSEGIKRVFLLRSDGSHFEDEKVTFFDDEKQLIEEVFRTISSYPIILTFNGDQFDLRYLYNRAQNLGISKDNIPISLNRFSAILKTGIHVDLYRLFFNRSIQIYAFGRKYSRMTLEAVSQSLLGIGKMELEQSISNLRYDKLAEYCLRDSELTLMLTTFDDDLVMKLITLLVRISKMTMEDVTRRGVSTWIRNMLYYEHRRNNYLIPLNSEIMELKGDTASEAVIKGKKYKGAIVIEPEPGVHFNVAVLDFASLYPSIIKVYNLSYETVRCPHKSCISNKVPDLPHWICTQRKGLSSLIIGSLRDLRVHLYKKMAKDESLDRAKKNLYNVIQLTLKVILNASYGVMGAQAFQLYCPPVAEAVTAIGRHAIRKTIEKADSLGIKVLYGDTDSIFLKSPTQEQIKELLEWSDKELEMELEIDKTYRYAAFSTLKKNYLGVYPDGSVDIKGMTGKKRHMPEFLQQAFMKMVDALGNVGSPEDFNRAKKEIKNIVRSCYQNLKNGEYTLEDLAFNVMLGKPPSSYIKTTPQHVKAARLLQEKGLSLTAGDLISYIKIRNDPGVKPVIPNESDQLVSTAEIDVDKYMEFIQSTFDQALETIGISYNEIMGIRTLDRFF